MSSFEIVSVVVIAIGLLASLFNMAQKGVDWWLREDRSRFERSVLTFWLIQDVVRFLTLLLFAWANIVSIAGPGQTTWALVGTSWVGKSIVAAEVALMLNAVIGTFYFFRLRGMREGG